MSHEPECLNAAGDCCPDVGALSVTGECGCQCTCAELKAAYQRGFLAGYNAHAAAAQHWRDTHGAYRADESIRVPLERYAEMRRREEENP